MANRLLDQRWPWLAAAALIVSAYLATFVEIRVPHDPDRRPTGSIADLATLRARTDTNVLFVLIDTLRADRLSAYGYERETSPRLDRLAGEGVRFAHQLSQSSWTKCSMASLWTGLNPARTGVLRFEDIVPGKARLPAEILKDAGFRTVGIYRNGWVASGFGFDQGFDVYTRPATRPLRPSVRIENPTLSARGTDDDLVAAALEFVRSYGRERWFLYLHLMDVHEYTYDTESALFGGSYSDIYDNAIRHTDGVIGTLLDHLGEQGLLEKTIVVVASDHGEAFRERGYEGHARRVYRETQEVPLLLSLPFRLDPGVVVEARTRNVDIWPTLLDLLGLEPLGETDGVSLAPRIVASAKGEAPPGPERTAIAHLDRHWGQRNVEPAPTVAVSDGTLRYVRTSERGRSVEELFDSSGDPGELKDRTAEDPAALARLREAADVYLQQAPAYGEAPAREIDELELNQLRALGYAIP